MGRRNKTHLCGPQAASVFVSKIGAVSGLFTLLLIYYCFRKDGFLRQHHNPQLTEMEKTALYRSETENKFLEITRNPLDIIRVIHIVPIGVSNSKNSGFHELSLRGVAHASGNYEEMPNATKQHSVFLLHSYDMLSEGPDVRALVRTDPGHAAVSHFTGIPSITSLQIYDQIQSTLHSDMISSSLKVRQFIEAIIHVRLSLQAPEESSTQKRPYNNNLRNNKWIGSKLQLNAYVADVHADLYQSVLSWVLGLSPSITDYVVCSIEKVSSEGIQWESEHAFKEHVVQRVERAAVELSHFQRAGVSSVADAHTLSVLGGRNKLKYL